MVNPHEFRLKAKDERTDPLGEMLAENIAVQRELLNEIAGLKKAVKGSGGGGDKAWDVWRILIGLALTIAMGAHALLWYLDKTVAVQTEQIESVNERASRNERDIDTNDKAIKEHLRDHNGGR